MISGLYHGTGLLASAHRRRAATPGTVAKVRAALEPYGEICALEFHPDDQDCCNVEWADRESAEALVALRRRPRYKGREISVAWYTDWMAGADGGGGGGVIAALEQQAKSKGGRTAGRAAPPVSAPPVSKRWSSSLSRVPKEDRRGGSRWRERDSFAAQLARRKAANRKRKTEERKRKRQEKQQELRITPVGYESDELASPLDSSDSQPPHSTSSEESRGRTLERGRFRRTMRLVAS